MGPASFGPGVGVFCGFLCSVFLLKAILRLGSSGRALSLPQVLLREQLRRHELGQGRPALDGRLRAPARDGDGGRRPLRAGPAPEALSRTARGAHAALAFPIVNWFSMALLYGRAGRLRANNGGFPAPRAVQFDGAEHFAFDHPARATAPPPPARARSRGRFAPPLIYQIH